MRSGILGPQKLQIIRNESHHLALFESNVEIPSQKLCWIANQATWERGSKIGDSRKCSREGANGLWTQEAKSLLH